MFIMIDGIDGSGKSTVIDSWKKYLAAEGNGIFDLKAYWLKNNRYPEYEELRAYDFILSGEPTYTGIGRVIRDELIKNGTNYSPKAIAEAYALDRLVLYKKILIPALKEKKVVLQDRGVSTSLAYQPVAHKQLTTNVLSKMEGNALALTYRPDHLVLLQSDPKLALGRLAARTHKQDDVIFEKLSFQTKIAKQFASKAFQKLFTRRGTKIHLLPADDKIAILQQKSVSLLKKILA